MINITIAIKISMFRHYSTFSLYVSLLLKIEEIKIIPRLTTIGKLAKANIFGYSLIKESPSHLAMAL